MCSCTHPSPPKNIKQGIQKTVVDLVLCQPTKHDVVSHVLNEVARNHACGRDLARCTLAEVSRRVGGALKSGLPIHAKLGLRFLACCSANSILAPKALAAVLDKVLDAAASARSKASAQDKRVKNYAYYADYLVYSALCALPSAAASLQSCEPDLLRSILAKARDHLGDVGRAGRMAGDALCVFKGEGYGNLSSAGEPTPQGGLVGHLNWVWAAYEADGACGEAFDWSAVESVVHFGAPPVPERKEEVMMATDGDAQEALEVKEENTVRGEERQREFMPVQEDELVPRGRHEKKDQTTATIFCQDSVDKAGRFAVACVPYVPFLPAQHTTLGSHRLNQVLVHEACVDLMTSLSRHPDKLVGILASLPAGGLEPVAVLSEAVFAHMLRLPRQIFAPVFYSGVISDLCLKIPTFPKYMSACVRYAVEKIDSMDLECSSRLSQWNAYHLSAFQFQWPFERWGWTNFPGLPPHDRRRVYAEDCFASLQRLAYHEHITKKVPEALHPLVVASQPSPDKSFDGEEAEKKVDMMAQLIYKKRSADDFVVHLEGAQEMPKYVVVAIFSIGGKSFTHMRTLLGRYRKVIDLFAQDRPHDVLDVLLGVWGAHLDKFMMAFACVLEAGIVTDADALRWCARPEGTRALCRSRAAVLWAVAESSMAACCGVAAGDGGISDGAKREHEAAAAEFWGGLSEELGRAAGGEWTAHCLQKCQGLARSHSVVLAPLILEVVGGCADETAKAAITTALQCHERCA